MRKWTEEEKAKQAAAIRRWKPWEKSTGPKTEDGKARSKMNGLQDGHYGPTMHELRRTLRLQRTMVRLAEARMCAEKKRKAADDQLEALTRLEAQYRVLHDELFKSPKKTPQVRTIKPDTSAASQTAP